MTILTEASDKGMTGLTAYLTDRGWQANVRFDTPGWTVCTKPKLDDAVAGALALHGVGRLSDDELDLI